MTNVESADQKVAAKPRLLYIDNLRILLTILVILHHLAIGYGAPGNNIYVETGEISTVSTILLTLFVAINQAFFMGFGESSLNFELLSWISDFDNLFQITSELHQEIDRKFRSLNIQIPFPQQDLHLHQAGKPAPAT